MATYTTPRPRPSLHGLALQSSSTGTTPTGNDGMIEIGDPVEVPGGMEGTVRFVGEVRGKRGYFVGVELSEQFASRGKNSGDADGTRYFSTSIPGAGIFLPLNRAVKKELGSPSTGSVPPTPTTPGYMSVERRGGSNVNDTSPTPAMPGHNPNNGNVARSMLGRAPSPALRPKSRPSLPRPESPLRRTNMPAPPRPPSAQARASLAGQQSRIVTTGRYAPSPVAGRSVSKTPSKGTLTKSTFRAPSRNGGDDDDGGEVTQLRRMIHDKNERINQLTKEFDGHRADFRKTLDALELAGEETQRVYETKIQELKIHNENLTHERSSFMGEQGDVETVAAQLRQLEEVVQELEEGLEDARRGEAEARGEVEFLRGEVERLRAELRWEREQGERAREEREKDRVRSKSRTNTNGTTRGPEVGKSPEPAQDKEREAKAEAPPAAAREPQIQPLQVKKPMSPAGPPPTISAPKPAADADKWCALCEQDGHDIMSCPNEDKL